MNTHTPTAEMDRIDAKKRKPKFAGLKVGDEVVIEDARGEIFVGTVVGHDQSDFFVRFTINARRREAAFSRTTGKGVHDEFDDDSDLCAIVVLANELQPIRDKQERGNLECRMIHAHAQWGMLSLDKLRTIAGWLDAAKKSS